MKVFEELSVFNRVTFVEKTHSYLVDGTPTNRPSVTRLLKNYKKQFDKEKTALRTAKKQKTTVAHVLAEWEMNNLYSTTLGSMLHKYIENFYSINASSSKANLMVWVLKKKRSFLKRFRN